MIAARAPAAAGGDAAGGPLGRAARGSFYLLVVALPWTIAPMWIAFGLCLALTTLWVVRGGARWPRTPTDVPALLWLAAMILATAFALDPEASARRLDKGLLPALVGLAACHAADPRVGRRALAAWLASAIAAAIFGLGLFVAEGASFAARARGPSGHYMTFGGQLLELVVVAAALLVSGSGGRWRAAAAGALAVGAAALAATFTRSSWVGTVAGLGLVLARRRPRGLVVLAVALGAGVLAAPAAYRERALSVFDPGESTNRERLVMWQAGVRMWRDHPLTGVGLNNLAETYDRYRLPEAQERVGHLHNVVLQVAAGMGVVGLATFILLYAALLRTASGPPRPRNPAGLAAGLRLGVTAVLAGFLVAGMFEYNFGDSELIFTLYTLVGLARAAGAWETGAGPGDDQPGGGRRG